MSKEIIDDAFYKTEPMRNIFILIYICCILSSCKKDNFHIENIYNISWNRGIINIDDFSGTDDDKIYQAVHLAENLKGGEIFFPNRRISISKAIMIVSNTKYTIAGQIQMIDSVHDNIFRSAGLKINTSAPNGVQSGAEWTENFEINFLPSANMRQSVKPLHVGDKFGWRGIAAYFVKCRNYKISNISIIESHMWGISSEYCENGYFENLKFHNTLYPNADGLNFRNGCRNMYALKLRGVTNDNAVAVTNLDNTIPYASVPNKGYSYQALGWSYGPYLGAENIIVEDVQVKSKYSSGLILATSNIVSNITYKNFISTEHSGSDWDNVSVCGNRFRTYVYGSSFKPGNLQNIKIVNSKTDVHEYSLGVYECSLTEIVKSGLDNKNPKKLGIIKYESR